MTIFFIQLVVYGLCALALYTKLESESGAYQLGTFLVLGLGLCGISFVAGMFPPAACAKCSPDDGDFQTWWIPITVVLAVTCHYAGKPHKHIDG